MSRRVFPEAQNDALRAALVELKGRKELSQTALGLLLGIKQQNVGRLLKPDGKEGFSYATAQRLVRTLGYASTDTFFRAKGVALVDEPEAKSA